MTNLITDSQDELTLEELFRDADQVHIPIFQRTYIWKQKQLDELQQDIRLIRDGVEKSQFLGAIVAYERPRQNHIVGRMRALAVVDGQQRLLTLYIYVMAIVERLAAVDIEEAVEVVREFLLLPRRRGLDVNTRIVPAFADRSQFRVLWDRLNSQDVLQGQLDSNPPLPPAPSGEPSGALTKQFDRIARKLRKAIPPDRGERIVFLQDQLRYVTRCLTFVHLKLNDASAATKIFERLNFRGVKVGIVDLVRNEVFSRVANSPGKAQRLFDSVWRPFEAAFGGRSEAFFFPYCLVHNANTKKSELFTQLRGTWNGIDPEGIVEHMRPYQRPFMQIDRGDEVPQSPEVSLRVERLARMKRPSVIYPFVIRLLYEFQRENVGLTECLDVLDSIESFLVRRAILGFEPTGLHALFKGLWDDMNAINSTEFISVVADKPTIQWPNDEELRIAIAARPIAKAKICNYLLVEYDRSLPGDDPSTKPTIEHILPQTYGRSSIWAQAFTEEQHKMVKDTWANVVPLSSPLNSSLQASPYRDKRSRYSKESMFKTPRSVAAGWDEWTAASLEKRVELLSHWALERWPHSTH